MAYGVIYKITCLVNGKIYIGQTTQPLKKRMTQHATANFYIGNAIRHHGWENFTVEVIEECDTLEQLNERERFWIAFFNCKSPNGYNLTDGGGGLKGCAQEIRDKMSASRMGKRHTAETCEKIALAQKGVPKSPEHRRKIGELKRGNHYTLGTHLSIEHRLTISAKHISGTTFKNLLKAMIDRQLTYGALAKLMGISQPSVSLKMQGKICFTAKDIAKLVEIFGLPAEYLMARDD